MALAAGLAKPPRVFTHCRLCRRIAIAVFCSIIAIEAVILVMSYRGQAQDLLLRLEEVGFASVATTFKLVGHGSPRDMLIAGRLVLQDSLVRGGAIYDAEGAFIGTFGEAPETDLQSALASGKQGFRVESGTRYEVVWLASDEHLPVTMVARLDASWIGAELRSFVVRVATVWLFISVVASAVTMFILGQTVLNPMLRLRENLMSARDDPANADRFIQPEKGNDELTDLTAATNMLLRRVSKTHREEMALFKSMADDAQAAVLGYDAQGELVYCNRAACTLCDCADTEELRSARLPRFRFGGDVRELNLVDSLGNGAYGHEAQILKSDGRWVACFVTAGVLRDTDGSVLRYYGSIADIAEIQEARERLHQQNLQLAAAEKSKSEFLANMSHELRTPLNAIIGFSDIMSKELGGPIGSETYRSYSEDIRMSGVRLLGVIEDILTMAEIDAERIEVDRQELDVADVIEDVVRMLGGQANVAEVELVTEFKGALPRLLGEKQKFRQILLNLVSNAIKFTPKDGRISVGANSTTDAGGARALEIYVADTGIGIAAEDIGRLLKPFSQADSGWTRKFEGIGLGLPLAKSLTELHDGELSLESEPGVGTIVRLSFPASRLSAAAA